MEGLEEGGIRLGECRFVHGKNETPILGNAIPVLGMTLKRG